ncbi:MAG: Cof-type HAD-IIB family hydrolase [Duncaniella sp.]|nr:Cof-type HAD-IIB family hydrolase [Duncaniella sp.]
MAQIKAVFFDIDGTLVPIGSGGIPESTKEALRLLRAKGIKVFISSGRHPAWINNLEGETFDGYVTVNGALCLAGDGETVIYKRVIDHIDIERLVGFVHEHGDSMPFVVVTPSDEPYTTGKGGTFENVAAMLRIPEVSVRPVEDALGTDVIQLIVFSPEDVVAASGLYERILPDCTGMTWCGDFADIVPRGSDKSVGIDRMLEHYGIDLSETMAFGDGGNDIGMLRHVAVGVAMGNAFDEVKAVADYVTDDVNADGVMKALKELHVL